MQYLIVSQYLTIIKNDVVTAIVQYDKSYCTIGVTQCNMKKIYIASTTYVLDKIAMTLAVCQR